MGRRGRSRESEGNPGSKDWTRRGARYLLVASLVPPAVAILLALPGFAIGWIMDDFDFLAAARSFRASMLLPDPGSFFYRPISRELYFGALTLLPKGRLFAAHAFNALILAGCAFLVADLGRRLLDRRAAFYAGVSFAALGAAPVLVAWACEGQDLLAILFSLLALELQLSRRSVAASCAMAAALLSKETAVAILPVVACLPWILGGAPRRPVAHAAPYAALAILWILIHPAPRLIGIEHASEGGAQYVGIGAPWRGDALGRTALTLANVPLTGWATPWPPARTGLCLLAIALVLAGSWSLGRGSPRAARAPYRRSRVLLVGVLLLLAPLFVTTAVVGLWAPRLAVLPAVGSSLILGALLARLPAPAAALAVSLFVAAGVWSRGANPTPPILCEPYLEEVSRSLGKVEAGFKTLHPSFPPASHALVSVAGTGSQGVWTNLHRFQALRVWYDDPGLRTLLPEARSAGHAPEFLFRITPELDVVEIDPDRRLFRSSGGAPDPDQVGRTIRTYARGVAATGEADRAIRILEGLSTSDGGLLRDYDLRLAAMIRLAQGKPVEAERLIGRTELLPRGFALDMVGKVFAEPSRSARIDSFAFQAFDVSASDTAAVGHLMRMYRRSGYLDQALEFARRMQRLVPGDLESDALIRELAARKPEVRITSPAGFDSL